KRVLRRIDDPRKEVVADAATRYARRSRAYPVLGAAVGAGDYRAGRRHRTVGDFTPASVAARSSGRPAPVMSLLLLRGRVPGAAESAAMRRSATPPARPPARRGGSSRPRRSPPGL